MVPRGWRFSLFALPLATVTGGNEPDNSSGSTITARYQSMGGERIREKDFFLSSESRERKGGRRVKRGGKAREWWSGR